MEAVELESLRMEMCRTLGAHTGLSFNQAMAGLNALWPIITRVLPAASPDALDLKAHEMVDKDPTGEFSYNCSKHGIDSGCKCEESGYAEQLEKAKRIVARSGASDALREALELMVKELQWYAGKYGLGPAKLQYALAQGKAAFAASSGASAQQVLAQAEPARQEKGGATMPLRDSEPPQRKQDCGDAPSAELRTSAAPAASEARPNKEQSETAFDILRPFKVIDDDHDRVFTRGSETVIALEIAKALAAAEQRGVEKGLEMIEKYGRTTLPGDAFITTDEQRRCYKAGVQTACDRIARALVHPRERGRGGEIAMATKYAIYLKGKPIRINPNSGGEYDDIQDAHARRIVIETKQPELDGELEVRPVRDEA